MNANRMKYASTPTYGLQKRGLLGRKNAVLPKVPDAPDFSQTPDTTFGQPLFSTPTQQAPFPIAQVPASTPWFPQGASIPPMQSMPTVSPFSPPMGGYGMPQQPFMGSAGMAQPAFGGMGMPGVMPGAAAPFGGLQMNNPDPVRTTPPLANNTAVNTGNQGFSPRAQGFVPPKSQQNPAPYQGNQPLGYAQQGGMPMQGVSPAPAVQPAPFIGGAAMPNQPMQNAAPYGMSGGMNAAPMATPGMPAQGMGFTPDGQNALFNQSTGSFRAVQSAPPAYNTPAQPKQRTPMDVDKLWAVFLFGLLPLLFIPCIFVPESLNFIRYTFLVLSVCGMGGMWYRQMYGSSTRIIISVVYVALCIVTVSMLMQGERDLQRTNAGASPVTAQTSNAPDDGQAAGMAATEAPSPTPAPAPTVVGKSEAQLRLETFMSNWAGNRVEDMVRLVQPSWATAQDTPANRLFMLLGNRTPIEYNIEEISGSDEDTSRTVTMTASIDKNNGKDPTVYRFMVLMVKEGGEWYVDPASLASNDEVSAETNVVNDTSAGVTTTEAPRTTVSPAPPASTVLYYNPDGGHYYHMDANCESINVEFRPLQGSFSYSDLASYINEKNLTPCLKCGAPTSTLPEATE